VDGGYVPRVPGVPRLDKLVSHFPVPYFPEDDPVRGPPEGGSAPLRRRGGG
jgi:hypothetical protein